MVTLSKLLRLVKLCRLSIVSIIVELKIDQYNYTDKTDNISQIVNISDIDSRISVLKNLKISWPQDEPLLHHLLCAGSLGIEPVWTFCVKKRPSIASCCWWRSVGLVDWWNAGGWESNTVGAAGLRLCLCNKHRRFWPCALHFLQHSMLGMKLIKSYGSSRAGRPR